MIANIALTGINYQVDDATKKYVRRKIGTLDKLAPRHARKSLRVAVKIAEVNRPAGNKYEVEVIMTLPEKTLTAKDSTLNALAAIDIVEAKLRTQLTKYKETTLPHIAHRGLLGRFKRSYAREQ